MAVPAAATASAMARKLPTLESLLCRNVASLHRVLQPNMRIASLDITQTHVSMALSDVRLGTAAPFGVLARTKSATVDGKLLTSALKKAEEMNESSLDIGGLVIGVPPTNDGKTRAISYTRQLLLQDDGDGSDDSNSDSNSNTLFPDLKGCLFYSEAHALWHALQAHRDFTDAIRVLPDRMESKRRSHFDVAMYPVITKDDLVDDPSTKARISASDILQAVLDDMSALEKPLAKPS